MRALGAIVPWCHRGAIHITRRGPKYQFVYSYLKPAATWNRYKHRAPTRESLDPWDRFSNLQMRIGQILIPFRDRGKVRKNPRSDQVPREGHLAPSEKRRRLENIPKCIGGYQKLYFGAFFQNKHIIFESHWGYRSLVPPWGHELYNTPTRGTTVGTSVYEYCCQNKYT